MTSRPILSSALALALIIAGSGVVRAASVHKAQQPIPGQYIVILDPDAVRAPGASVLDGPSVAEKARALAFRHNGFVGRTFEHALKGFVLQTSAPEAEALADEPGVAAVAEDGIVRTAGVQTPVPSWGLDRIDQQQRPLDGEFMYDSDAAGLDVYVIDSGIMSNHVDFGGRVDTVNAFTAFADGYGTEDCNGHGTLVAGIIGSATYGVAKGVTLHPVRVINCAGAGSSSDLVAGIDWVTQQEVDHTTTKTSGKGRHQTTTTTRPPAVANISLESLSLYPIDYAVEQSIAAGVTYVVAAGNSSDDACLYSPGDVSAAITVAASDDTDALYSYSNVGSCVDLFAPGVSVPSTYVRSTTDVALFTGTSAAAPMVAGAAAIYLAQNPTATPADVEAALTMEASTDLLTGLDALTPNRLLFSPASGGSTTTTSDAPPVASFTFNCNAKNGRCSFDASSSSDDVGIASYDWDFGDGGSGSGSSTSYRYAGAGVYTVTLTVTDTAGQTTTVQKSVSF